MTKVITDEKQIDEALTRGVVEVIVRDDLRKKMVSGTKLRIKLGIDPTSPHIHLGRAIPLLKLRDFAELGHHIIFIVGDFTGVIGDTSDKESERPMLEKKKIEENKKSYFTQIEHLFEGKSIEFRYNSEWLESLTYREIGEHADQFSVADFIARENIQKRLDAGTRVSLREVLYPLMQGYDSVAIDADVEIGGTDQRFNLLAGRTLQSATGKAPQNIVITGPLLMGTDGRKMSSSWGNTINITDTPENMYGKIMSVTDSVVPQYFELCTRVSMDVVHELIQDGHPKEVKMRLAKEIVTLFHGEVAAEKAENAFDSTFSKKELPEDIQELQISTEEKLVDVLVRGEIVKSKTEFRRLVDGGGIQNRDTGEKITMPEVVVEKTTVYQIGKRRFVKVVVG